MRLIRHLCALAFAGLIGIAVAGPANAEYPEKAIEFVIPFGAGGGADIEGRLLASEMSKVLGVPVVPVNKPGGGGAVTYSYIKNAKPDGYRVGWNSTSILTSTNIGNVPFKHDAMDHVGRVEWQPNVVAVKADARWKTLKDFVQECRDKPKSIKMANAGTGSTTHVSALEVLNAANCELVHLPVGVKRRNSSVLSGEADSMIAPLTGAVNLTKAGKMRILAVLSEERNPLFPDVPTAKEQGFDATLPLFRGLSVPKGTPKEAMDKLTDAMIKAAKSDAFMKLAKEKGFTVDPIGPEEFAKVLSDIDGKVVAIMKEAGLYQSKAKN